MAKRAGQGSRRQTIALTIVVMTVAGCHRQAATTPRLVELIVARSGSGPLQESGQALEPLEGARDSAIDVEKLRVRVADELRSAGLMDVALGTSAREGLDYKLVLGVRAQVGRGAHGTLLRAFVVARLDPIGGRRRAKILNQAIAEREVDAQAASDLHGEQAHVERAVDDVIRGLIVRARLHLGKAADLVAALSSGDPDAIDEAISAAAERRDTSVVPSLIKLLDSDDLSLRDRALGALVEIGDTRAVRAITGLSRFQDTDELPKVLDALGSLGGDEARSYLEFVARAHEDGEMQAMARSALDRMGRMGRMGRSDAAAIGTGSQAP